MELLTLGPFHLLDACGVDRTPRPMKLRILLAMLVVNAGRVLAVSQLKDELWLDGPPRNATNAMHVYVSQLRKHLRKCGFERDGESSLVTRPPGYLLRATGHGIDLLRFEDKIEQYAQAEAVGDLEAASGLLNDALNVWSGPALADVRSGPVLGQLGVQLDETYLATYERRIRIDLALGRHHELVGELHALVGRYPHWESLHGYLMIALYRASRTAEALAVYGRLREELVDSLGLEPGTYLQELHRRVLNRDEVLDLREPEAAGSLRHVLRPLLAFASASRGT